VRPGGRIPRRDFLRWSALIGAQAALAPGGWAQRVAEGPPDLVVARGDSPALNGLAAVEALGGFPRFVKPGDVVAIKPNPVGRSRPEAAIHTHPELLETVVRECRRAGATEVVVFSHDDRASMVANGTAAAVERGGGRLLALSQAEEFREVPVPRGRLLRRERIAACLLDADVFINMPIAKHHAGSEVTLSLKNLMGVNWDRLSFHRTDLHQCIAELGATVRPDLIIMDANHVLLSNGPVGPGEVTVGKRVIAGTDPVAVDALTVRTFFGEPERVRHIRTAYDLGAGEMDLGRLSIREFRA
jgi:uncharacterized protein (DUF362 family)